MMRRTWLTGVILCMAGVAWAGPQRDAVLDVLSGIEQPPTQEVLLALGDSVTEELLEIALDSSVPVTRRGRAITALAFFPTDPVRAFLESQLAEGESPLFRRKAAGALAAGWGVAALPLLQGALEDSDAQLRIATVGALAQIDDEAARTMLQERLVTEADPTVKDTITKALKAEVAP